TVFPDGDGQYSIVELAVTTQNAGVLQFSATAYSVDENGGSVSIEVTRTGGSDGEVTVDYATSDGSATVVDDYTGVSGTLTFPDGDTSETFNITIINDVIVEGDETVNLTLSNPTGGATIGPNNPAVLTIVDDDVASEPNIGVNPSSLAAAQLADTQTTQVLTISNTGDADLDWNLAETETTCSSPGDIPWVSTSPASGTTPPSGSSTVDVVFDSAGLATGSYTGTLCIGSNDPDTSLIGVPVSLQVIGSVARHFPEVSGNAAESTWTI
ncbi:Na-Ca exchanger/integrin-beta4 domain protein, partial [Candidatus Thiomargarita nelsonii]